MGKTVGKILGLDADIPAPKTAPPPQPEAKGPVVAEQGGDAAAALKKRSARTTFRRFVSDAPATPGSGVTT